MTSRSEFRPSSRPARAPRACRARAQAGKLRPWLAGLLVLAAAGGGWAWSRHASVAGAHAQTPPASAGAAGDPALRRGPGGPGAPGGGRIQPVSVGLVQRQDVRVTLQAIGSIAAANTAVVRSRIEGELKALHFKEGQLVQAGALLAELDDRAQRIALAQAEGQLARDQAQQANARVDLARFKDLLAKDGVSRQQVDTQEALVRQLQGTVQIDQAQVDNARLQLSYTRITAPIAGRAGLRQADLGNTVRPADTNGLLSIAQTHPVNVVFAVPEAHLPRIAQALREKQPLAVEAWDREQRQRLAAGRVTSADNAIDAATGTIRLKAAFPNADDGLFPNQFVNVRLQLGTLAGALTVPAAAVLRNNEGSFVYVVGEDKTVAVRPVHVDAAEGEWVAVKGELQPGARVVTDGVDRLRDGARVELIRPGSNRDGQELAGRGGAPREGAGPAASGAGGRGERERAAVVPVATAPAPRPELAREPGPVAGPSPERLAKLLERLPPEVAEKVKAMSPEERREWLRQAREERMRREAAPTQ